MNDTPIPPATRALADIAEHAARMHQPLVSFRQIAPTSRSPAPPPGFLFGPSNADLARALFGQIETPEIGVYAIADAAIAPTGIALRDGVAFYGASLNLPETHVATITKRIDENALPPRFIPGPLVVLFGPAEESHAQLITDHLPRLWLVLEAGYNLAELRCLVPAVLPPVIEAVVEGLGLGPDRLVRYAHWEEIIHTDLALLPTVLRRHARLAADFGHATRLWTSLPPEKPGLPGPGPQNRLFLTGSGGPANIAHLEAIATGAGYRSISPDAMDLTTRIAEFGAASHIVGPYNLLLDNCVFSRPGTRLCALRDTAREPGFLLSGIAAALGLDLGYVFGAGDGCLVDEADFRRGMEVLGL